MRIQSKIFLAILGSSLLLVAAVLLLFQWSVTTGMLDYVNNRQIQRANEVAEELREFYHDVGSWEPLHNDPRLFRGIVFEALDSHDAQQRDAQQREMQQRDIQQRNARLPRPPIPLALLDSEQRLVAGHPPPPPIKLVAVELNGINVGWLVVPQVREINTGFEREFLRRQRAALVIIGTALIAVASIIAFPLARHLVKPIRQLARGTDELTHGNYAVSLPTTRRDELGELARNFNELALTLEANESSRKRWLADISHELRTPLSILRGELEAILDGVRPADSAHLQSLHQEIQHLSRLVDDLHALTTADIGGLQYRKAQCDIAELWRDQCAAHEKKFAEAGLTLSVQIPDQEIDLYADEDRLRQLFDNLLDNSRKYTAAGGTVRVDVNALPNGVELIVQDTAPGVPDAALPKLFDHLFRVEDSRNRATGGSGLGLAICQRIVTAHEGEITAAPSTLGGLLIRVFFPYR